MDDHGEGTQAANPIPPWEQPGSFRRDCEPHRGEILLWPARVSLILGVLALIPCCGCVPGIVGIPIGLCSRYMAKGDLAKMRAGLMNPYGEGATSSAANLSNTGLWFSIGGTVVWGGLHVPPMNPIRTRVVCRCGTPRERMRSVKDQAVLDDGADLPSPYVQQRQGVAKSTNHVSTGCLLRFETAADNWETIKLLLKHGAEPARQEGYPALDDDEIDALVFERGWLVRPRQAYLGYVRFLQALEEQEAFRDIVPLHTADDIATCFDKPHCQERLARVSLPVPRCFAPSRCYEELRPLALTEGRLMVKMAHGSGAAGCIALHSCGGQVRAITTVAEVAGRGESRLFHSKRICHLTSEAEIAALVDRLCVERVHVEAWLPKARLEGENFDLRIVTIGGVPRHVVVRTSPSVFTNLTLGSRRGNVNEVTRRMGLEAWQHLRDTAARVARAFPQSFTLGIDVLVRPDWQRHAVLEVNAFGDLLLGQLDQGEDTYTATLSTWQRRRQCAEAGNP